MANAERGGVVEKYQTWNRATRNIAAVIALGGLAMGNAAIMSIALVSAGIDQVQIVAIDKWKNRKGKN